MGISKVLYGELGLQHLIGSRSSRDLYVLIASRFIRLLGSVLFFFFAQPHSKHSRPSSVCLTPLLLSFRPHPAPLPPILNRLRYSLPPTNCQQFRRYRSNLGPVSPRTTRIFRGTSGALLKFDAVWRCGLVVIDIMDSRWSREAKSIGDRISDDGFERSEYFFSPHPIGADRSSQIAFALSRNYILLLLSAIFGVISPSGNECGVSFSFHLSSRLH